jgi:molybdate transport system regulatory protein
MSLTPCHGLSIRNQLPGVVTAITPGEAMATVRVRLAGVGMITAAVTLEGVEALGIEPGSEVRALVKATEVALATGPLERLNGLSIRNKIPGTVESVVAGNVMASVKVAVEGAEMTAVITREAAEELGLAEGSPVVALVKSTEVSLVTA